MFFPADGVAAAPQVILAKEEADTALTYRSAFTIFMLSEPPPCVTRFLEPEANLLTPPAAVLVSVSAETFFGRPVVTLEDPPVVKCIKIEHDATRKPRIQFSATVMNHLLDRRKKYKTY